MKYTSVFMATGLAITTLMGTSVKGDKTGELLNQLQLVASTKSNGNANDSTENLVTTILEGYRSYIRQIDNMAKETESPAENTSATPAATFTTGQSPTLQTSHIQPGGPLKEVHLAGYPALPDVPPVSSVTHPTAAQLREKAATDWEQTRIQMYYFAHPGRSPN